jgi:hypothetical protein
VQEWDICFFPEPELGDILVGRHGYDFE